MILPSFKEKKEGGLTADMRPIRIFFIRFNSVPQKIIERSFETSAGTDPWLSKTEDGYLLHTQILNKLGCPGECFKIQTQKVGRFDDSLVGKINAFKVKSSSK